MSLATHRPRPELAQRPAADPTASVWVSASAGTGKTKVLTDRVLRLLLAGTLPQRILCLTFTKAAAAEMSNRVNRTLGNWAVMSDRDLARELTELTGHRPDDSMMTAARRLFAGVLDAPGGLAIQTIHGFCQSLLRRFPIEAGVAPHFAVMDERSAEEMLVEARAQVLAAAGRDEGALSDALAVVTQYLNEDGFAELMAELTRERARLEALIRAAGGVDRLAAEIHRRLGVRPGTSDNDVCAAASDDKTFDGDALRRAVAALERGSDSDRARALVIARWLSTPGGRIDMFDAYVAAFVAGSTGEPLARLITKPARKFDSDAEATLRAEAERLVQVQERRRAVLVADASTALLRMGAAMLEAYRRQKQNNVLLDYDDLILASRDLLHRPAIAPWVLYKLDGGIDHILIDEAQDTNPEQWQVVAALAQEFFAGAGAREADHTVFAVGDVKQSIFSFQRADPAAFERMRRHFAERVPNAGAIWREVPLEVSFRSADAVLRAVDAVFAHPPACDGVAVGDLPIRHEAYRTGQAGLVELWPSAVPPASEDIEPWRPPVAAVAAHSPRARLARLIALKIRGWIGKERLESKGRPVRAGDIMILVRRRGAFVGEVVRELKSLGVPVAGVDRMVLTEQLAIMDLMALGQFLLLPEDDLTLATVLKGPLIGLTEDQLYRLAHGRQQSLWTTLRQQAHEEPDFARAEEYLARLLSRADLMPPYELYARVLGAERGRKRILARLGPEAADPLDEFLNAALLHQRHHPPSLQGFLHWLAASSDEIKRDLEQGTRDEVRVLTVHGAKGLQAPIVILPDTLQKPDRLPKILWPPATEGAPAVMVWPPLAAHAESVVRQARAAEAERQIREYRRLLYVAMTRAEDRLYICGWETRRAASDSCWYALVLRGLTACGQPVTFDFSAEFPGEFDGPESWRGEGLRVSNPQIEEPESDKETDEAPGAADVPDWLSTPPVPEADPPAPIVPSRGPALLEAGEPPVEAPFAEAATGGVKRGLILHRLLQSLPDLAEDRRVPAGRNFLAQPVHGLSAEQQASLLDEALAVLGDPEAGPLFGADSRAEAPIVGRLGRVVVAGQVDRLAVLGDRILLIDFKTNRSPPVAIANTPPLYLRQMALYRALLRDIFPDKSIICYIGWTVGPRLVRLDDGLLDRHLPSEAVDRSSLADRPLA